MSLFDGAAGQLGQAGELRLLVVDGDDELFDCLVRSVDLLNGEARGACRLARHGEAARGLLEQWAPAVVLVDVHVDGNGLGVIRELAGHGVPVVAVSQERLPELEEGVARYGASGYFTKSEDPEALEALLAHIEGLASERQTPH